MKGKSYKVVLEFYQASGEAVLKFDIGTKKEIDYNVLSENYNKVDFNNFDFNTNIDNLKDVELGANILLDSISKNLHICIVTDYDFDYLR